MKTVLALVSALLAFPAVASAQDEKRDRRMEELRKWHDQALRDLDAKFRSEREKIEGIFREKLEALRGGSEEKRKPGPEVDPMRAIERLARAIEELRREVEALKKRSAPDRSKPKDKDKKKKG